jgi:Nucleotide modification associated domain 2
MNNQRIYVYKCVVDDGAAPCIDAGLFTLTICKPYIRSTARPGNWIFAFGSNAESPANRLVYIAEVSRKLTGGKYFEREEFKARKDCIYERLPDGCLQRRGDAKFHDYEGARISDLGAERSYPKANAIVSGDFRYFGKCGTNEWKTDAPKLCKLVEGLGQGHRVNFMSDLRSELVALKNRVWCDNPDKKVLGTPLHAPDEQIDWDSDDVVKVCKVRCYYIPQAKQC